MTYLQPRRGKRMANNHADSVTDAAVTDVGTTFNQATLNANFNALASAVNASLAGMRTAGVLDPPLIVSPAFGDPTNPTVLTIHDPSIDLSTVTDGELDWGNGSSAGPLASIHVVDAHTVTATAPSGQNLQLANGSTTHLTVSLWHLSTQLATYRAALTYTMP